MIDQNNRNTLHRLKTVILGNWKLLSLGTLIIGFRTSANWRSWRNWRLLKSWDENYKNPLNRNDDINV